MRVFVDEVEVLIKEIWSRKASIDGGVVYLNTFSVPKKMLPDVADLFLAASFFGRRRHYRLCAFLAMHRVIPNEPVPGKALKPPAIETRLVKAAEDLSLTIRRALVEGK